MHLSIVSTLYYSAPYIKEFFERISRSATEITDDFEVIFVNDGSPDDSLRIVLELYKDSDKIRIIDLSRNFGHHKAIMTGLSQAEGDYVFLIDCDLEEEPELLASFYRELTESKDLDVVYGVQNKREGAWFRRLSGGLFYKIFNLLSDVQIPEDMTISRMMTKRYVENLIMYHERELVFAGISTLVGFEQKGLLIDKKYKGKSDYTLRKKFALLINSVTSFSNKPLIFIFYIGLIISIISSLYILKVLIQKIFFQITISGWTSLIISIWFLSGIIIFSIGLMGLYLSKVFTEIKKRPYTIIKRIYSRH